MSLIAVPKEDRVVHRDTQLQHRCQRLCHIGDLAQEHVGSQVIDNGHADAGQKQKWHQERIHRQHEHHTAQRHRHHDVDRRFCLRQVLGIHQHG